MPYLLKSIKKQNYQGEIEIIVADAGSKDKTREIAKKFGCRIVEGGLPAKGRNEGAKMAKGDILLFIDADIVLPSDFLTKALAEFFQRNLDIGAFLFTPFVTSKKMALFQLILGLYNLWTKLMEKFLPHAFCMILVKKVIHNKISGFDEEIKLGEDHDYARRAKKFGRYGVIKGLRVPVSMRRFEKDGTLLCCLKFLFAGLYMLVLGPIKKDIFKYRFNHYDD